MKRVLTAILLLSAAFFRSYGQETPDSTAVYDVFSKLSENLSVEQSDTLRSALSAHVGRNERRSAEGLDEQTFRIRIYLDNGQKARGGSEAAAAKFRRLYPGVPVSRTFSDAYYKVTVGNYSSRAEAATALKTIQKNFPSAFIVRN